jgi:hypothetical protein
VQMGRVVEILSRSASVKDAGESPADRVSTRRAGAWGENEKSSNCVSLTEEGRDSTTESMCTLLREGRAVLAFTCHCCWDVKDMLISRTPIRNGFGWC